MGMWEEGGYVYMDCPDCNGSGEQPKGSTCRECGGRGWFRKPKGS